MGDIIEVGKPAGIENVDRQLELECVKGCNSKIFKLIVVPLGVQKGAAITKVQCAKCGLVFTANQHGVIGDKSKKFQDHQGKNHYRMKCETGVFNGLR